MSTKGFRLTIFTTTLILLFGAFIAGLLGSLSGMGGGVIIVPLIVLGLSGDVHYAIGTSLLAVIATSTASSCAYVKEGYSNIRLGILLETATTVGALLGVVITSWLPATALSLLFGVFLLYSAYQTASSLALTLEEKETPNDLATVLRLNGDYPVPEGKMHYYVQKVPLGYFIMFLAGSLSAILGIGAGVLKVVVLDRIMRLPFKVSTTTSNFMMGVTAAASAGLYLKMGYIDPVLTLPVILGVSIGSFLGARILPYANTQGLRGLLAALLGFIGIKMILSAMF